MNRKKSVLDKIAKLGAEEQEFLTKEFLSPRRRGQSVSVRISGIIMQMGVEPRNYEGWGVFRPISRVLARFERPATMEEKFKYLELFPCLRLVVSGRSNDQWYGVMANRGDTRFKIAGNVPIYFSEEIQLFDTVRTRFDGTHFWFESLEPKRSARIADELRQALSETQEKPNVTGLTIEEESVYNEALERRKKEIEEANKDHDEERLKRALQHAGAAYLSYQERGDMYTVEYSVDGERHTSVVSKANLSVQAAGICLSGGDRSFDLTSLVTVIREGRNRGRIVRVGNNAVYHDDPQYDDDY